jgi:hypothetical protein
MGESAPALGTTFADLLGKLTVIRVECAKCGRFGRYPLHRLIDRYGGKHFAVCVRPLTRHS